MSAPQAWKRLRTLLHELRAHAVITLAPDRTIQTWNADAEELFGFSAAEAIGASGDIIFTPEDRAAGEPQRDHAAADRDGSVANDRWYVTKSGALIFASCVLAATRGSPPGAYLRIVQAAADLNTRRPATTTPEVARDTGVETEARQQLLRTALIAAQEHERRRIARDLHDHFGQLMTALHLQLEALRTMPHEPATREQRLRGIQELALQLDRDLDFFTWELRPGNVYEHGLPSSLRDCLNMWSRNYGITADLSLVGLPERRFTPDIEINLYRIGQEALTNVQKHARASHVEITLQVRDDEIVLTVEDDGRGFDTSRPPGATAIGLVGMRERALLLGGRLVIESAPGRGTTVIATVPAAYVE